MASMNKGVQFIFGDITSNEMGVSLASEFGSTSRNTNVETRNIITTSNIYSNIFNFHGVTYEQPLQFDIIIYNDNGLWIDAYQERMLKKWLLKNKFKWFRIDQEDLSNIEFYCIGVSAELINVGTYTGGMKIQFQADAPWAWSSLMKKTYTTVNNTLNVNLNMDFDIDKYLLYPTLQITTLGYSDISITNSTTNETISITGCTTNESIIVECSSDKISSSASNIINRWNKNTISMKEGLNQLILTGNFKLVMSYRLPIRVGA